MLLFIALLQVVQVIDQLILPNLPTAFSEVWNTMWTYLGQGFHFLSVVFAPSLGLIRSLILFWIGFGATVLTIEVFYGLWRKITGNAGREAVSESTTFNADGEVIRSTQSRSTSKPRLPRF